MITAILQSLRPKQWTKNLFVFAGLLFTLDRQHPTADYVKVLLGFALFCMLSGSIYLINDIRDVESDRMHPRKSKRPIASGRLPIPAGWTIALILLAGSLAASVRLDLHFAAAAAFYATLLIAYSLFIKSVVILDVMAIAAGFVLRAVAGAAVLDVIISPWLLICTVLIALFLGLAKRRGEMTDLAEDAVTHRSSLEQYTIPFLDQLLNITAASTIISYALYTFFSETGQAHQYMMATVPFVIYGIFRYMLLIHQGKSVDSPELMLLTDKPLLADVVLWGVTSAVIVALG